MATKAVHLAKFETSSLALGPIEPMYGGSGLKAQFLPVSHVVLPALRVPWKVEAQRWQGQANASAKLAVTLTPDAKCVEEWIQSVERAAMAYVDQHRSKFFPGKKTKIAAADIFNCSIRRSPDFDPVFPAKLAVRRDESSGMDDIKTPCFDMQTKDLIDANVHLNKGAIVVAVVQPEKVYVINNSAGVTWKVVRIGIEAYDSDCPEGSAMDDFDFGQ